MKASKFSIAFLALTSLAATAQNSRLDQVGVRSQARELRNENIRTRSPSIRAALAAPTEKDIKVDLTLGLAYTNGDDQTAWNTPVIAAFQFPETKWKFSLSTLGFEHDSLPEQSLQGWTDLKFKASYPFVFDAVKLVAGIATRLPAHGEVGSDKRQDEVSLSYGYGKEDWNFSIASVLKRNTGAIPTGVSRYPRYGAISISKDIDDTTSWGVTLDRLVVPGRAGVSTAGLAYDFALLPQAIKDWGAEISLSKGISKADRSTSIEFDINHQF